MFNGICLVSPFLSNKAAQKFDSFDHVLKERERQ